MTSDEVMMALNEAIRWVRDRDVVSETGHQPLITRETALSEFYWGFDPDLEDEPWTETAELFRGWFNFTGAEEQLRPILERPAKSTVGALCDVISQHATTTEVREGTVLGVRSWEIGIYRALRAGLAQRGVDVSEFRPSSRLEPFLLRNWREVWSELSKLNHGRLPSAWSAPRRWWFGLLVMLLPFGLLTFGLAWIVRWLGMPELSPYLIMAGAIMFTLYLPLLFLTKRWHGPTSVSIEGIDTITDLCHALAVHWRARPSTNEAICQDTPADRPATFSGHA